MRIRRDIAEFGLSFLDVISCGFGAVILLLMITKTVEPVVLEQSAQKLAGIVTAKENALFDLRGQTKILKHEILDQEAELKIELEKLAKLERELTKIKGQFAASTENSDQSLDESKDLASAKQTLTDQMERLLGVNFERQDNTIGGITVDSEYIIFVIDTSGSMQQLSWSQVIQKVNETLNIYPSVKGIQILNDMGDYMFPRYQSRWIPDSPARRRAIVERLRTWAPFSNSSPVEGIERAVRTFYAPDKRISIYVFGDDFSGRSIEEVTDTIDRINRTTESGDRLVRIHAIGFPGLYQVGGAQQASLFRFAALMRELTYRNNGTFVGLAEFQ
ncbi:MAG: hypothetical protein KUG75_11075 [Pseudomonadales bacterium]|nr:hypothetical protein [Pseudomonadales bacterium]